MDTKSSKPFSRTRYGNSSEELAGDWEERIDKGTVSAFTVPTSSPEADGTLSWSERTLVIVHVGAAGELDLGYTYADVATAELVARKLKPIVLGASALRVQELWRKIVVSIRNLGRPGISLNGYSGGRQCRLGFEGTLVDNAPGDLLGQVRDSVAAYGRGGFTSCSSDELRSQFRCWVSEGFRAVNMKIKHPDEEKYRVYGNPS